MRILHNAKKQVCAIFFSKTELRVAVITRTRRYLQVKVKVKQTLMFMKMSGPTPLTRQNDLFKSIFYVKTAAVLKTVKSLDFDLGLEDSDLKTAT